MATYENLHGRRVNVVSSNPSNPKEGEVWYNSTLGLLKGYVLGPATVESAGNVNTARTQMGSTGALTAGLMFGGESPSITGATEEFDGSTFSNGGTCQVLKLICTLLELKQQRYGVEDHLLVLVHLNMMDRLGLEVEL